MCMCSSRMKSFFMCVNACQRMTNSLNNNNNNNKTGRAKKNENCNKSSLRQCDNFRYVLALSPSLQTREDHCVLCLRCTTLLLLPLLMLVLCCVMSFLQQFNVLCLFLGANGRIRASDASSRHSPTSPWAEMNELEEKNIYNLDTVIFHCNEYRAWLRASRMRTHKPSRNTHGRVKYKILSNPHICMSYSSVNDSTTRHIFQNDLLFSVWPKGVNLRPV